MKLLDKRTISEKKSSERKMEIDEGAKLARKIDVLRETASSEEVRLSKFREESLKQLRFEVEDLELQKSSLVEEVSKLKIEREELIKPITEEIDQLHILKKDVESKLFDLANTEDHILRETDILEDKRKSIEVSEERARDNIDKANEYLSAAKEKEDSAQRILNDAHVIEQSMTKRLDERSSHIITKELELSSKERDLKNIESNLKTRESELTNRERAINDKYGTLLRAQKYAGKCK